VTARARALVVLNPSAHGGAGARRFEIVRTAVDSAFDARIVVGRADGAWRNDVHSALDDGVRAFVAAGGDGTAHSLVNALIEAPRRPPLETLILGAVGLGSSNDLHKPVRRRVGGVPVLLDASRAAPRDIVRCVYGGRSGAVLISASIGVTASANARFSADTRVARCLRRTSTVAAVAWAAGRTIAAWRNLPARLRIDGGEAERVPLTSLSVLKTEWVSGRLRYGHAVAPASGDFDVAVAEGLGRARLLLDVLALLRGRFDGRPGHRRCRARSLDVWLDHDSPLEIDGEIALARAAHFDMLGERIRLCA